MNDFVYLASQSPRRSELLKQLGVKYELLLPDASEDAEALEVVHAKEAPKTYVQRVTALKLGAARTRHARLGLPEHPILCADTTVALGRQILGKPVDANDAMHMLGELSGRTHRVLTAVAIAYGDRTVHAVSDSLVTFHMMSNEEISDYVASGEPMGKAGAYGVQGRAAAFISCIHGSYTGIMGLPLFETAELLKSLR